MKIAVSTSGGGLKDVMSPVFGRCPTFTIVTIEGKEIKKADVIPNPGNRAGGGAGVAAAQTVIDSGAEAAITGNCGPNAIAVLNRAGVKVYLASGTVEEVVKALLEGKLSALTAPSVPGHFGPGPGGFGRGRGGFGRGRGRGGGQW